MQGYGKMGMGSGEMPMRKKDVMGKMTSEVELPSFAAPPDAGLDGDSGVAEVSWRSTGDGMVEITAINGVSLSGESESENNENEEMT